MVRTPLAVNTQVPGTLSTAVTRKPMKKALLIGISYDKVDITGTIELKLRGPHKDALNFRKFIVGALPCSSTAFFIF